MTVEVEYNQKQDQLKKQLNEVMNQISALAKEGKSKLSDSVTVTAGSKITASTVETTTTIHDDSSIAPVINGGSVQNTGTNTGLIKAGDSNNQSIVVNTEINIDKGHAADLVVNNLVESMSGMTSKAEGVITDIIGSVEKSTTGVAVFTQNSSTQVVC